MIEPSPKAILAAPAFIPPESMRKNVSDKRAAGLGATAASLLASGADPVIFAANTPCSNFTMPGNTNRESRPAGAASTLRVGAIACVLSLTAWIAAALLFLATTVVADDQIPPAKVVLVIHGGAGAQPKNKLTSERRNQLESVLTSALKAGLAALQKENGMSCSAPWKCSATGKTARPWSRIKPGRILGRWARWRSTGKATWQPARPRAA